MHNKFGVYYNKQFNCIIITLSNDESNNIFETKEITILKKDDTIVGINIFNIDIVITKTFITSNEKEILEYINQRLINIVHLEFEKQFLVGKITSCEEIPNTHLNICSVDIKEQKLSIVCGAANARKDLLVVVATIGAWMPNGLRINEGKLRGFDSFGMLCSASELNTTEYNENGVIELNKSFENKIGEDFWRVL